MLFKLSIKNLRKSMKDYAIYFLTLILGVAIFYVFNALGSQDAMKGISQSGYEMVQLMVGMLGFVSVIVAFILGFLIVYANNFLIKRRKKEFGVYMLLGMGKGGISRILLGETVLIGLLSLGVGLVIGIFASQFMSILVAKLFEADLTAYTFTVSIPALKRTVFNFGIMYIIVLIFNALVISRYRLIDLFQAGQKGEKQTLKNTGFAVLVFLLAAGCLGYAYYQVGYRPQDISLQRAGVMIALGCVGTFFTFWSLSGFLLKLLQHMKRIYHKNLNAFILRQLSRNMNTAVFSMTVICLLLFATICAFGSGMSMNNSLKGDLQEMTPVDMYMMKTMDLPEDGSYGEELVANSHKTVAEMLEELGFSMSNMKEGYVEVSIYTDSALTFEATLGSVREAVLAQFPVLRWQTAERIMGISEYNRLAALYGIPLYELGGDEYLIICDYENMAAIRNLSLEAGTSIAIGDITLKPAYPECKEGYVEMSNSHTNAGIILVPDEVIAKESGKALAKEKSMLAGNYAASTEEEKKAIDESLLKLPQEKAESYHGADGMTKIYLYEASVGLAAVITFVVLYLGIVFLISGAALLALKALSESTDSKGQYAILQKVGADNKMLHGALFSQIGLFFILPLIIAVIHSFFGMRFISFALAVFNKSDMLKSVGTTAILLLLVYGGYFLATYYGSRRIIEEK